MIKKISILVLFVSVLIVNVYGTENLSDMLPVENVEVQSFDDFTLKDITDDILSGGWSWDVELILKKGLSVLFSALVGNINLVLIIFVVSALSAVLFNLQSSFGSQLCEGGLYAIYIVVAGLCTKGVLFALDYANTLVSELDVYIKTLIPVVMSVVVASGNVISGVAVQPLVIGISQLITFVVVQWLIPSMTVVCGMCVVNHMSDKADLTGMILLIQKGIRWCAGILLTVFVGIMTIQCMITPALDSVSGRLTRYAIANFVPVLGGLISDSISVVAGYSAALKGAVGGAGIIMGVIICVKPLAEIASVAVLYNISSALLRPVCDKRITGLLSSVGQVITTLLVLMIMIIIMFVINLCVAVNIGGLSGVVK